MRFPCVGTLVGLLVLVQGTVALNNGGASQADDADEVEAGESKGAPAGEGLITDLLPANIAMVNIVAQWGGAEFDDKFLAQFGNGGEDDAQTSDLRTQVDNLHAVMIKPENSWSTTEAETTVFFATDPFQMLDSRLSSSQNRRLSKALYIQLYNAVAQWSRYTPDEQFRADTMQLVLLHPKQDGYYQIKVDGNAQIYIDGQNWLNMRDIGVFSAVDWLEENRADFV